MIILAGASGGLGRTLLPYLLELDDVIGLYHTRSAALPSLPRLRLEKVDLTKETEVRAFTKNLKGHIKNVSVLNFAAHNIFALAARYRALDWDQVMNVNLKGCFLLCREFMPLMIQQNWGRFIHASSVITDLASPGTIAYATSKSGLLGLSKVLAKEGARFNITSNVLSLGMFDTGIVDSVRPELKTEIRSRIPSNKFGHVANIGHAVEFLIKSDYTTGSVIKIDGALT